jgi:ketosteroid isomerase-like protein
MKITVFVLICLTVAGFTFSATRPSADEEALRQQILSKEREELEAVKRGDSAAFANLIADDAVFVDPRGSAGKAEVVKNTADFKLIEYSMEDIKFVPVSATSGVVAYKLTEKGVAHGHEFSGQVHASALWLQRDGKWVCAFSQETPARKPEPARP